MRKSRSVAKSQFSILTVDDDPIMTSTLQAYFQNSGYQVDAENDPLQAIERIRSGRYDILLLDFLMTPICGDQVVEEIRKFNKELFIILLTGHKSMAPPIKTIRELDIQGYYEKSDRFDQLELLVESCSKSITQMRTIKSYQSGLSAIIDFLPQIYHLQSIEHIYDNILQGVRTIFHAPGSFLALDVNASAFLKEKGEKRYYTHISGDLAFDDLESLFEREEFQGQSVMQRNKLLMAPIVDAEHRCIGRLGVELPQLPLYEQFQLLEVFTRQVSAALHNTFLHAVVNAKNEELIKTYQSLRGNYMDMISAMRLLVDAKDLYTRGHSDRVSQLALDVARAMNRDEPFCERVRVAGLFHDIGKIGVPDEILQKPGPLTDEEFKVIERHPVEGAKVLSAVSLFREIVPIVRGHHERIDGRGYPDGLRGERIPEEARIIAVADSLDAMLSDRHYRRGMALSQAVEELHAGKGGQFDPVIADTMLELIARDGEERFLSQYGYQGTDNGNEKGDSRV